MPSTLHQKQNDDPHDVLVVAPDVALVVPTDEELSRLAQSLRHSSGSQIRPESDRPAGPAIPPVDTTFRPSAVGDAAGRARTAGGRAVRTFTTALLLAFCTAGAAFAWQSYGDEARAMIAQWLPQGGPGSLVSAEKPAPAAQPVPPAVEAAATETASPQPASPPAAAAAPEAAATAAAVPPGTPAEQLRSMARDLASAGQEIEQLKANIEQLKAGQQQMSREIAKAAETRASEIKPSEPRAAEQNPRPRLSALPPRPAARVRRPVPLSSSQAAPYPAPPPQAAAPYAPPPIEPPPQAATQTLGDPELAAVPRPPMPVR